MNTNSQWRIQRGRLFTGIQ